MTGWLLFWIILPVCAYILAGSKRRNQWLWALGTLVLPPAILILLCLPGLPPTRPGWDDAPRENIVDATWTTLTGKKTRECPYCAETILARARLCKHCGKNVKPEEE